LSFVPKLLRLGLTHHFKSHPDPKLAGPLIFLYDPSMMAWPPLARTYSAKPLHDPVAQALQTICRHKQERVNPPGCFIRVPA
jgi:hypothetical protein